LKATMSNFVKSYPDSKRKISDFSIRPRIVSKSVYFHETDFETTLE